MQQSQLIMLCRSLSKSEWRDVHDFAASPTHNRRTDAQDLLRHIESGLSKIKTTHLDKEKAWKKTYPTKPYDDAAMRYLMFLAQTLVQNCLAFNAWQTNEMAREVLLIKDLRKRNNTQKLLETEIRKTAQLFDNHQFRNFNYYYQWYEFKLEHYEYGISQQRDAVEGFQAFSDALNVFFMAQKLRQGCAALSQNALNKSPLRIDFLPEVLAFLAEKEDVVEVPLVALFYYTYRALSDNQDVVYFNKLKALLFEVSDQFTHSELRELYLNAINCCIRRINAAQANFIIEVFDIYRKGLETKALLEGNTLSRYTYNNIVMAGVRLKEFDWIEKFIHEYKPFLEEKFCESTFNHALATFYFKKKDFPEAMVFLQNAEFDDVLHNLDARRMLACIYYDLSEFEALDAHLEAFKNFLYRHKNIGYHRENCLHFIRFLLRFMSLDFTNKADIKALEKEILSTSTVVEKDWLLEKLKIKK